MPLPANVQLITESDGIRLVLPPRPKASKAGGCAAMMFGLVFSGFALFWMWNAAGGLAGLHDRHGAIVWANLVFALFGIPFFLVGLIPMGLGFLSFFPSHAEIVITSTELMEINYMGRIRIRRRRPIAAIRRLRVGKVFEKTQSGTNTTTAYDAPTGHTIFAEQEGTKSNLQLGSRYPLETLVPVAEFLLSELKSRGHALELLDHKTENPAEELSLTVDKDPDAGPPPEEPPPPPQPAGSAIVFVPAAEGLTFMIPRTGFRGSARFFLLFSLFWNGMSFLFFGVTLSQLIHQPTLENLGILGFVSIFNAIGIAVLLASIQLAYRKAVLLASKESLVFSQTGPLRKSEFQWNAPALKAVRCCNSSTSVNGTPLKELRIEGRDGAKGRGLMQGRDEDELEWIAANLRSFYRLPKQSA
jgi:hypothetical protein